MTEQQAIKYLFCSGMSELQVNTVVKAIKEPYIKAIEDIRAEIEKIAISEFMKNYRGDVIGIQYLPWASVRNNVLEIIDKHDPAKAESVGDPDKLRKETI